MDDDLRTPRDDDPDVPKGGASDASPFAVPPDEMLAPTDDADSPVSPPITPEVISQIIRDDPEVGREIVSSLRFFSGRLPLPDVLNDYDPEDQARIRADYDEQRQMALETARHDFAADDRIIAIEEADSARNDRGLDADIDARKLSMRYVGRGLPVLVAAAVVVAIVSLITDGGYAGAIMVVALVAGGVFILGQMGTRGTTDVEIRGVDAQAHHIGSLTPGLRQLMQGRGKDEPPPPSPDP